jgi:2'-5' RNA ligase
VIRAFVAIKIDPDAARKIGELHSELDKTLAGIRWVKPENLHLTLKFLGPVADDKITPIAEALERALCRMPRFSVSCRGLGVFPDIRKAKVLWVGLEGKSLVPLSDTVEAALEPMGFAREKRAFQPHLTIGRWRDPVRSDALRQQLERSERRDFGASKMAEVIFFQSVLKPGGAIYTPLKTFPLADKQD